MTRVRPGGAACPDHAEASSAARESSSARATETARAWTRSVSMTKFGVTISIQRSDVGRHAEKLAPPHPVTRHAATPMRTDSHERRCIPSEHATAFALGPGGGVPPPKSASIRLVGPGDRRLPELARPRYPEASRRSLLFVLRRRQSVGV